MEKLVQLCSGVSSLVPFVFGFSPALLPNEKNAFCSTSNCSLETEGLQSNVGCLKIFKDRSKKENQLLTRRTEGEQQQGPQQKVTLAVSVLEKPRQRQMKNDIPTQLPSTLIKEKIEFPSGLDSSSLPSYSSTDQLHSSSAQLDSLNVRYDSSDLMVGTQADQARSAVPQREKRNKKHIYDICNIGFASKGSLKRHIERHSCGTCGKYFRQFATLKRHIRIHTGEKPHKCDECGFSCCRADTLKRHQNIHTGDKPYNCEACGKPYRHKHSLKKHTDKKHTEQA